MNDSYNGSQPGQSIFYSANSANTNASNSANTSTTAKPTQSPQLSTTSNTNPASTSTQSTSSKNLLNDMFAQLNSLNNHFINYQNSNNDKINELNLKLNYMNDTIESLKSNLNNVNSHILLLIQNSSLPTNGTQTSSIYSTQTKMLDLFSKHIANLGKEIEDLAMNSTLPTHLQHPQLQSQHLLRNPPAAPRPPGSESSGPNPSATASGYDEDVDELNRAPFKALPTSVSNPTSPFIPNRFNFDINSFRHSNNFQLQQPHSQPFPLPETIMESESHDKSNGKAKRRKTKSKLQDINPSNSYILPLPGALISNDDENSAQKSGMKYVSTPSLPSNQFIRSNENELLAPGLRQQRPFFSAEIENSMELNENSSNTQNSSNQPNELEEESENAKKNSPKRKKTVPLKENKSTTSTENSAGAGIASSTGATSEASDGNSISLADLPSYKLERSLKTISDIWKEYEYGLNDKPPLRLLEIKYGTKWRNETESRTFLRRKKIYEAIEAGKSKGFTEDQIINDLEEYRSYDNNGTTKKKPLSWLCSNVPEKFTTNT